MVESYLISMGAIPKTTIMLMSACSSRKPSAQADLDDDTSSLDMKFTLMLINMRLKILVSKLSSGD